MSKRLVPREEFFRELGVLSGKIRRRRRLRSEYFTEMAKIRPLMAERRELEARRIRYPPVSITERAYITRRLREITEERERHLTRMRDIREILAELEASIERERIAISRKKIPPPPPPPPKLHRIKIRVYNEQRKPTPTGMFQCWFEIDALIDPETGLVDWDWHLTKDEIEICKYHMIGYFRGMNKWRSAEQITLAYFNQPEGIPYEDSKVEYKRKKTGVPYAKNVPEEFIRKAETLTVSELIVGISSVMPEPNPEPSAENMGILFERGMIINAEGLIKWDEIIEKWIWHPSGEEVEKIKKELKMK